MVATIPTFQSDRVTQIPSMGITDMSGMRAMGGAISNIGRAFEQIANVEGERADQLMKRKMMERADADVRDRGLDPAKLADPVTAADSIYRQAAMNTYAIKVERDVDDKLNAIALQNRNNPSGYKAQAEGYLKGTVSSLPWEMRNGVEKSASSVIAQRTFAMQQNLQARAIAESEALEDAEIERLSASAVNAEPEMRGPIMDKINTIVSGSTKYITTEGRNARVREVQDDLLFNTTVKDVMEKRISPADGAKRLAESGVAVTPGRQEQLNNAEFVHDNYEARIDNIRKGKQAAIVSGIEQGFFDQLDATIQAQPDIPFSQLQTMIRNTQSQLRASGVSGEAVLDFANKAYKSAATTQVDNYDIVDVVDDQINAGQYDEAMKLLQSARGTDVSRETYQARFRQIQEEKAGVISNPVIKQYLNEYEATYAPNASLSPGDFSDPRLVEKIRKDKAELKSQKTTVLTMQKDGKSVDEIVTALRSQNRANKEEVAPYERVRMKTADQNYEVVRNILTSDGMTLKTFDASGKELLHSPDNPNTPPEIRKALTGKITKDNFLERAQMMKEANSRARQLGITEPYPDEAILEIRRAVGR